MILHEELINHQDNHKTENQLKLVIKERFEEINYEISPQNKEDFYEILKYKIKQTQLTQQSDDFNYIQIFSDARYAQEFADKMQYLIEGKRQ